MKVDHVTRFALALLIALASMMAAAGPQSATGEAHTGLHEHQHHHPATDGVAPAAPPGGWATDAPLRAGMLAMLHATIDAVGAQKDGVALAAELRSQIQFLFAECTLQPAADAALHRLIAELLRSVQQLEAGATPAEVHDDLHATLVRYGREFDHPDWPLH